MTEEEARGKLCPIVTNTFQGKEEMQPCIASQCMAWRWDAATLEYAITENQSFEGGWKLVRPSGDGWEPCTRRLSLTSVHDQFAALPAHTHTVWERPLYEGGHCGIAGSRFGS